MRKKRKEEGKTGRSKHRGFIQYTEKMKEAMFHLVDQLSTLGYICIFYFFLGTSCGPSFYFATG